MTSSELYHVFGLVGYQTKATRFEGGKVILEVESTRPPRCSNCRSADVLKRGCSSREFQALPVGTKQVLIRLDVQRLECRKCGLVRLVKTGFAAPRRHHIKRLAAYVLSLLRCATIKDVAALAGLSWDVVKDIQKRHLTRRYSRPRLGKVRRIAIDEISIGKHHRYLTVVLNLDTGRVLFVGDGKGSDALKPFWRRVRRSKGCTIKSVAIDMSTAYISAVTNNLPEARIVFDRFHIVKLCNEMLTRLRRALYREATDLRHKEVLKGTRWLVLKNPENIDRLRDEGRRLQEALELNAPLAKAYYMKDELRQLWAMPNKESAERFLAGWIARAEASGIGRLKKFAHTLAAHRTGILAWYDDPISTGPLEGTNNKIKTMKRQAYGFRDIEFLKLRIMGLHETKYALVG
ncbi:MAG: ISL3 family transposase [Herbaspirillum sp.]|uniref:ISL3 family transposase n=1 Tax=Herbaspirillum sp. TaxID=1890675 RepID=UPI00258E08D6|nr:ISL3 family transposase [Herbaspirillum sp.]MCP4555116.1 ISL3 family transposase [Herbaspirillum sp.]